MKVITHIACEFEPNNPEQGKILVEMDRYEFQALTSAGRAPDGTPLNSAIQHAAKAPIPGGGTIEVDGVRYAEVGPAKPKDWRPPVGATFNLRTDISDARGCLQQALKALDAFYLIEPTKRRDPAGLGRLLHELALGEVTTPGPQDCADTLGYLTKGFALADVLGDNGLRDRMAKQAMSGPLGLNAEAVGVLTAVTKDAMATGTGIFETAVHIGKHGDIQFSLNRVTPPDEPLKVDLAEGAVSAEEFSAKIGKAALKKRKPAARPKATKAKKPATRRR